MTENNSCLKGSMKFIMIAFLFFIGGFFLGQSVYAPTQTRSSEQPLSQCITTVPEQTLEFMTIIDYGDGSIVTYKTEYQVGLNEEITVYDVLSSASMQNKFTVNKKYYDGMGSFITQIGDKKNGDDNKYWQYTVNDVVAMVSADTYILDHKEDNVIKWTFAEYKNE